MSYPKTDRSLRALNLGAVESSSDMVRKANANQTFDSSPAIGFDHPVDALGPSDLSHKVIG